MAAGAIADGADTGGSSRRASRAAAPEPEGKPPASTSGPCLPMREAGARAVRGSHGRLRVTLVLLAVALVALGAALALSYERVRALDAARRESQARLELVVQSISDGYMEWDVDTDRLRFSKRFRELVGLEEEATCVYATFEEKLHPDDRAATFAAMQAHLDHGAPYFVEYRLRGGDGSFRWFESRATALRDGEGRPVRVVGSVTDIDARKRAEEAARARTAEVEQARDRIAEQAAALRQVNDELALARDQALDAARTKSAFLANMSHELRTPLNAVLGLSAILLEGDLATEQREVAETLRSSGDQLAGIVDSILDFSHLDEGRVSLDLSDFDVREIVGQAVADARSAAEARGLALEARVDAAVPAYVSSDPGRIRQVLDHLVGNAVKFTTQGSIVISVGVRASEGATATLAFEVQDTGIGIAPELHARLLQPFTQADDSNSRRFGGTGLGLAICKKVVEMLRGELEIESERGRGSTFRFLVRVEVKQSAPALTLASAELRGLRVLVAEPRSAERSVLLQQLGGLGVETEEAEDAHDALARLRIAAHEARAFDLVFLSQTLPDDAAFSLAGTIRETPELGRVRPFLLAAGISRRTVERARAAGFAAQLTLPIRQSHLHDCMLAALPGRRATAAASASSPAAGSEPRRVRVLVAEDNPVNQRLARRLLEKLGFEVELVENGLEAVRAMAAGVYDAVLMDCQMPRMDGFEATREIRRREGAGRHTPIIAVTANAMPGDRERCLDAGMDDYVAKPVKREVLAETLKRWLARGAAPEPCTS